MDLLGFRNRKGRSLKYQFLTIIHPCEMETWELYFPQSDYDTSHPTDPQFITLAASRTPKKGERDHPIIRTTTKAHFSSNRKLCIHLKLRLPTCPYLSLILHSYSGLFILYVDRRTLLKCQTRSENTKFTNYDHRYSCAGCWSHKVTGDLYTLPSTDDVGSLLASPRMD